MAADPQMSKGAQMTRTAVLEKIRRMRVEDAVELEGENTGAHIVLDRLERWVLDMDERYNKRIGGLGRK